MAIRKNTVLMAVLFVLASSLNAFGQWKYDRQINFPASEAQYAAPFLCTVAENGKLYLASSKSANLKAHDAIWYMSPGDTVLSKLYDFTERGDTINVRMIVGMTTLKNSLLVSSKINPSVAPGGQSCGYYFEGGDTASGKVTRYGYAPYLSGWGTFVFGIALTKDSVAVAGTDFTKGLRFYNFTKTLSTAYAAYMAPDNQNGEPGGPSDFGFDVIRDVAVVPGGDYFNTATPIYTSRNSKQTGEVNGGIAVWTGGSIYDKTTKAVGSHANYTALRVTDDNDDLALGSSIPYGITVDKDGLLWVAGIDSTRRWVKGFKVEVGLLSAKATEMDELPSAGKMISPDPDGAPMRGPADVAFSADGMYAYVIDAWKGCVYRFYNESSAVENSAETVNSFSLEQNYPNPFNPTTNITFSLSEMSNVRLSVYNVLGQEVATLVNGMKNAGSHTVEFNAENLSNGIYLYTLKAGDYSVTKKMALVK